MALKYEIGQKKKAESLLYCCTFHGATSTATFVGDTTMEEGENNDNKKLYNKFQICFLKQNS